jgi:anti-anti-sigma factor
MLEVAMDDATRRIDRNLLTMVSQERAEFIDSTGLAVIIRAHWRSTNDGHSLDLTRPPKDVMRILELCGLDQELPFVERSQDGALGRVFLADLGGSDGELT